LPPKIRPHSDLPELEWPAPRSMTRDAVRLLLCRTTRDTDSSPTPHLSRHSLHRGACCECRPSLKYRSRPRAHRFRSLFGHAATRQVYRFLSRSSRPASSHSILTIGIQPGDLPRTFVHSVTMRAKAPSSFHSCAGSITTTLRRGESSTALLSGGYVRPKHSRRARTPCAPDSWSPF